MENRVSSELEKDALNTIKQVNKLTGHTWAITKVSNGLLLLFEVLCYLIFIAAVGYAIMIPNGVVSESYMLSDGVTVETSIKVKEVVELFSILKTLVIILGSSLIIPARLFRNIRKKNNLLEELNDITKWFIQKHNINEQK